LINGHIVLVWAFIYTGGSIGFAYLLTKGFKLPPWVTPACAFNNTTSLPLLLLQSLESVGSLHPIVRGEDTVPNAIRRAQSYFLVCAVVSKTIGYAVGPRLLEVQTNDDDGQGRRISEAEQGDAEAQHASTSEQEDANEETSLLPDRARKAGRQIRSQIKHYGRCVTSCLPKRVKQRLLAPFESPFADVMITCTIVGVILGSVPQLHKAFFYHSDEGGIFNAWLTSSVKNIGQLFTTLQIFIVGGKLGLSFDRMGGRSGRIPFRAILTIFLVRLVLWPAISISFIYALSKGTNILQTDPILWFSMMLMPAGPPALVISGLAELAKIPETEKIEVAKTLTIMYALSPFVCLSITGALKASQAALEARSL
jgi:hypothetical protein